MSAHSSFTEWDDLNDLPEGLAKDIGWCITMNIKVKFAAFATMCRADHIVCVWYMNALDDDDPIIALGEILKKEIISGDEADLITDKDNWKEFMQEIHDVAVAELGT